MPRAGSNARRLLLATVKENVSLTALDAETGEIVAAVPVGTVDVAKPHEFAISKDGARAFVSLYGSADYGPRNKPDNRLAVVDLDAMTCLGHIDLDLWRGPHAMTTDRDGKIWVTVDPNCCVLVIDPESWEIERCIWLETPGHFLSAAPDGRTIYFSAKEYPVITEVDVAAKEVTARIPLPLGAQAIRVSPDGARLYVGDFNRPLLHVIDCASRKLVETVPLTGIPGWPFNDLHGERVIVTTYDPKADRGYVEILNASNLSDRRVCEVASEPFHALPTPDGRHIHVALADGGIPRIDLETAEIDGGFHAGGRMVETLLYLER